MIAPHKSEKITIKGVCSKTIENAKNEEITASKAVKKTVNPMLVYLLASKGGHFSNISELAPAQKIKKRVRKFILY
jgi:hypothetical protein